MLLLRRTNEVLILSIWLMAFVTYVKATFGSGGGSKQQVVRGDAFDVPIVQPPYPDVIASGNVIESTATPLAAVAVGVEVKKGAPRPDISNTEAVKKMLLSAKSIVCPDAATGAAAGVSINEMLKKLGIDEQVEPKLKRARGGGPGGAGAGNMVSSMVANGDGEIGMTFVSEMSDPGIDIVGIDIAGRFPSGGKPASGLFSTGGRPGVIDIRGSGHAIKASGRSQMTLKSSSSVFNAGPALHVFGRLVL